ncbi:MAG: CapA family protein [Clostridiales bacterium]|nr:CapA family protein [Clostridiales bacterium]
MEENKRSFLWDNAKGLLIFFVVFGHFIFSFYDSPSIFLIITTIYTFHMPAFAFISGRFTKEKTNFRKLIIAYVIFNGLFIFCSLYEKGTFKLIEPYYICWYLVALCVWRLVTPQIAKHKFTLPVLIVISLICGFSEEITNVLAASRILAFWPFFMCGYLLKDFDFEKARKTIKPIYGIFFGMSFLILILQGSLLLDIAENDFLMAHYPEPMNLVIRIFLFFCASCAIFSIIFTLPDKKIPLISSWGRNSMSIFLIHRFFTLFIPECYPSDLNDIVILSISFALSFLFCLLLGNDHVSSVLNRILSPTDKTEHAVRSTVIALISCSIAAVMITSAVLPYLSGSDDTETTQTTKKHPIYRVMSDTDKKRFDDSFKIIFAGDLILLEDQVKLGYDKETGTYDYNDLFEYTKDEISSADLAIGVLEGPLVDSPEQYSVGNFDDGKKIYLGFPDAWAEAIRDAGFDLVTTANNHMLDRGEEVTYRTMDKLDELGLDYTGTYRNPAEKESNHIHMIEQDGLRIAVLSYTFGMNRHETHDLITGELSHISSFLVDPNDEMYEQVKASVKEDFDAAKALEPDLILVLPHMGTQFLDAPDEYQTTWHDNFVEFGADIILSDHTHTVQPAFLEQADDRTVFTAYCPGNYADIFREYNGDATALVEVYIDRETKRPIGGGIVPMWVSCQNDGNYRPVPVYDIVTDPSLQSVYSTYDMQRVKEVHEHITGVMLDTPLSLDMVEPVHYFDENGYMRTVVDPIELTSEMDESPFMQEIRSSSSVCFIGDSITHGTKIGGVPWYEPLLPYIEADVLNFSAGGWSTVDLLDHKDEIPKADLYVVAIGTNDFSCEDPALGALNETDYIANLAELKSSILSKSPNARFIFIDPWISISIDKIKPVLSEQIDRKRGLFCSALKEYCLSEGDSYVNVNDYLAPRFLLEPTSDYLVDWIHPSRQTGIYLYCEAVLISSYEDK